MVVGIDVSQSVFGTGVSDYTINLVASLRQIPQLDLRLFAGSLRQLGVLRSIFPDSRTFPLPPQAADILWNRLHLIPIESFLGPLDVFHSSDWAEPPARCPKVTTVHDLSPFLFPDEMTSGGFRDIRRVHTRRMSWVAKESERIICVSQKTAADLKKIFSVSSSRIFVIPEALPERFNITPTSSQIHEVKAEYGLTDYLVTVGTRQPRKNLQRLIAAFQINREKFPHFPKTLVIIGGSGWQEAYPDTRHLIFTGYVPDWKLSALIRGSKLAAFPSLYEGFGLPVLVAFRNQVPVVTSVATSLAEVAGNAAVLVNPMEIESIAEGLRQGLHQSAKLVKLGLIRLTDFSWLKAAAATVDVYKSVC